MALVVVDEDTGERYYTTQQAADRFIIRRQTFSAHAYRGYAPKPCGRFADIPVWSESSLDRWAAQRASS